MSVSPTKAIYRTLPPSIGEGQRDGDDILPFIGNPSLLLLSKVFKTAFLARQGRFQYPLSLSAFNLIAIHRLQVLQGPLELRVVSTDYHANRALIEASRTSMALSSRDLARRYMRQEIWVMNKDDYKEHGVSPTASHAGLQ